jgi:RNA polymerase sigma-70 factor (ECF subfamily)
MHVWVAESGINYRVRNDLMDDERANLAAQAKSGNRPAVNALLERHLTTVYKFVAVKVGPDHPELDDIVQETLIGAAGSIRGLRGETDAQVAGWLLSIARHKVADHLRARYRNPHESLQTDAAGKLVDPTPPVDELVVERDRAERLREALKELTPEQEEVLILRFILGFGINEVAEITRRPAGAVKSMQHRALSSLQQKLGPEEAAWV